MFKKILLLVVIVSSLFSNEYENIANKFLQFKNQNKVIKSTEILKKDQTKVAYLFNLENGGYIIVPISKSISPIKSYSFHNNYDSLPLKIKEFLVNELHNYISNRTLSKTINSTVSDRWDFLETFTPETDSRILKSYTVNTNLLTTSWEQGYPYNKYFPKIGSETTLAGCVQVAFAQIMKYHSWPQKGKGVVTHNAPITFISNGTTYISRYEDMEAVLNRHYNWEIMENEYSSSKEYQENEVAYLMRDLVVFNKATIGLAETSAVGNINGLVENFGYSNTIATMNSSDSSFINTVKSQIDQGLPVLFSLPGHMVVADGYNNDTTGEYIHLNMGWGASSNTFYNISEPIVAGGFNFTTSYDIIYNVKPCSDTNGDCYKNLETSDDTIDGLNISGNFDMNKDTDGYKVFLSGSTTLSGTRGYSNYAFYINIFDSNNSLVTFMGGETSTSSGFTLDLPSDLYSVKVSLCSPNNSCYNIDGGMSSYNVNISSQTLTSNEQSEILSTLSFPPVIDQTLDSKLIIENDKIVINAYDKNDEDNVTFEAVSNNENVTLNFNKNILTLEPNVASGHSKIKISVSSNNDTIEKEFDLLINDEQLYYGNEYTVTGEFDSQQDINNHQVILDGICNISGQSEGYSNQAFYTKLLYITSMSDSTINTSDLNLDFYSISSSLENDSGSYYPYDVTHNGYTLSVSCPDADNNITELSSLLNITLDNSSYGTTSEQSISLQQGWNLVSANLDLNNLPNSIEAIWKYSNSQWKLYTELSDITEETLNSLNISQIESISNDEGIWIKTSYDDNVTILNNNSVSITQFNNGWTLAGTGVDLDTTELSCNNDDTISVIWKYKNEQWLLATDIANNLNLESFNTINKNEGFWIHCY